jgi:hypothetical protein
MGFARRAHPWRGHYRTRILTDTVGTEQFAHPAAAVPSTMAGVPSGYLATTSPRPRAVAHPPSTGRGCNGNSHRCLGEHGDTVSETRFTSRTSKHTHEVTFAELRSQPPLSHSNPNRHCRNSANRFFGIACASGFAPTSASICFARGVVGVDTSREDARGCRGLQLQSSRRRLLDC